MLSPRIISVSIGEITNISRNPHSSRTPSKRSVLKIKNILSPFLMSCINYSMLIVALSSPCARKLAAIFFQAENLKANTVLVSLQPIGDPIAEACVVYIHKPALLASLIMDSYRSFA